MHRLSPLVLPEDTAGEGVALQGEAAALGVEGEVVELHGAGHCHAQPHLVQDLAAEVNLVMRRDITLSSSITRLVRWFHYLVIIMLRQFA